MFKHNASASGGLREDQAEVKRQDHFFLHSVCEEGKTQRTFSCHSEEVSDGSDLHSDLGNF